jgi:Zn-dependent peptidase ImmA (M78 family)
MEPEELLRKHNVTVPAVPVHKIAKLEGIQVVDIPAADDISGALVRNGGRVVIAVNPRHHIHRRRFTVAHELGHFFRHSNIETHVDQDFRIDFRDARSSGAVDWMEITANEYAACLLMPTEFLLRDVTRREYVTESLVVLLAMRYEVSTLAMRIRLTNLGMLPAA